MRNDTKTKSESKKTRFFLMCVRAPMRWTTRAFPKVKKWGMCEKLIFSLLCSLKHKKSSCRLAYYIVLYIVIFARASVNAKIYNIKRSWFARDLYTFYIFSRFLCSRLRREAVGCTLPNFPSIEAWSSLRWCSNRRNRGRERNARINRSTSCHFRALRFGIPSSSLSIAVRWIAPCIQGRA